MIANFVAGSTTEESGIFIRLAGCSFLRNSADANTVAIAFEYVRAEIYDCLFANNDGNALLMWFNADSKIYNCVFRENTGSGNSWPGFGAAVVINPRADATVSISDTLFEANVGVSEGTGGALTLTTGFVRLDNVRFLSNTASHFDGGGAFDVQAGAKVTATKCFALGNVGLSSGGGFNVIDSTLTVMNSKSPRVGVAG